MAEVDAVCRIFSVFTPKKRGEKRVELLGLGCVVDLEPILPRYSDKAEKNVGDRALLASKQVLTKDLLKSALGKRGEQDIKLEFPAVSSSGNPRIVNIIDLFESIEEDVKQSSEILSIAITEPFRRNYELATLCPSNNTESILRSGEVKCHVLARDRSFSCQVYDFVPDERAATSGDNGVKYLLRGDSSVVAVESDLPREQIGIGSILLTTQRLFVGFAFFSTDKPGIFPLVLGATSEEVLQAPANVRDAEEGGDEDALSGVATGGQQEEARGPDLVAEGGLAIQKTDIIIGSEGLAAKMAHVENKHPTVHLAASNAGQEVLQRETQLGASGPAAPVKLALVPDESNGQLPPSVVSPVDVPAQPRGDPETLEASVANGQNGSESNASTENEATTNEEDDDGTDPESLAGAAARPQDSDGSDGLLEEVLSHASSENSGQDSTASQGPHGRGSNGERVLSSTATVQRRLETMQSVPAASQSDLASRKTRLKQSQSMPNVMLCSTKRFKLETCTSDSVLECNDLLNGLSRCLDVEYLHGDIKCWKDLAEDLAIPSKTRDLLKYSPVRSPTQELFEFMYGRRPNMAIGELKAYLRAIEREDVFKIIQKHIANGVISDTSQIYCLPDMNPDIVAEISPLLDIKRRGVKSWEDLADEFGEKKSDYKYFGSPVRGNPTKLVIDYVCSAMPHVTVGNFKNHIQNQDRRDVVLVVESSSKVKDEWKLERLEEDWNTYQKVCLLLNEPVRLPKKNWKNVGESVGVPGDKLAGFEPHDPGETQGPTEALFKLLKSSQPELTLKTLLVKLHKMNHLGAVECLMNYIITNCTVSEIVGGCEHPSCQSRFNND